MKVIIYKNGNYHAASYVLHYLLENQSDLIMEQQNISKFNATANSALSSCYREIGMIDLAITHMNNAIDLLNLSGCNSESVMTYQNKLNNLLQVESYV